MGPVFRNTLFHAAIIAILFYLPGNIWAGLGLGAFLGLALFGAASSLLIFHAVPKGIDAGADKDLVEAGIEHYNKMVKTAAHSYDSRTAMFLDLGVDIIGVLIIASMSFWWALAVAFTHWVAWKTMWLAQSLYKKGPLSVQ